MHITHYLLIFCFKDELTRIFDDKNISIKTISQFYSSFKKFNFIIKFAVFNYLLLLVFFNTLLSILMFFKLKYNNFNFVFGLFKKIPFLKNIQNFVISFLLLHTDSNHDIQKYKRD